MKDYTELELIEMARLHHLKMLIHEQRTTQACLVAMIFCLIGVIVVMVAT